MGECECEADKPLAYTWEKTYICRPVNNIESHSRLKCKQFQVSYSKPCAPPVNMWHLLSWQYYRQWRCELSIFNKKVESKSKESRNRVKPDLLFNKKRFAKLRAKQAKILARANPKKQAGNKNANAG